MRLVKGGPGMEVLKIIEDPVDLFIIINGDTITLGLWPYYKENFVGLERFLWGLERI